VADWYDPLHPAVLHLIADVIAACNQAGKKISICGEMAGDPAMTDLLLGLGLRSFSMQPAGILPIKQHMLQTNTQPLVAWAQQVLQAEDPQSFMAAHAPA